MKTLLFSSVMTLLLAPLPSVAASTISSEYTGLGEKDCKTIEANPDEGGSYKGSCKGIAGYKLILMEGDIRQTITITDPKGKEHALEFWSFKSGFSAVGEKAEWRVAKNGNKKTPIALITRFNVSENPDAPEKTTSYLIVSKITPQAICVTDIISPKANANALARQAADNAASKPCKKPD